MNFNFKETNEQESSFLPYVGTGIHDFKVDKIFYQPVGDSVNGETKKDKSLVNFTLEQIRVQLTVTQTHAGKDSKGATTIIGILTPKEGKEKEGLQRLLHIFVNMTTNAKKEAAKAHIQKINVTTLKDLAAALKAFEGRTVRYKFAADQNKKYAQLPNYYGGFAEPADIPFSQSTLTYDEAKEGTISQPKNAEVPTEVNNSDIDPDQLPF